MPRRAKGTSRWDKFHQCDKYPFKPFFCQKPLPGSSQSRCGERWRTYQKLLLLLRKETTSDACQRRATDPFVAHARLCVVASSSHRHWGEETIRRSCGSHPKLIVDTWDATQQGRRIPQYSSVRIRRRIRDGRAQLRRQERSEASSSRNPMQNDHRNDMDHVAGKNSFLERRATAVHLRRALPDAASPPTTTSSQSCDLVSTSFQAHSSPSPMLWTRMNATQQAHRTSRVRCAHTTRASDRRAQLWRRERSEASSSKNRMQNDHGNDMEHDARRDIFQERRLWRKPQNCTSVALRAMGTKLIRQSRRLAV